MKNENENENFISSSVANRLHRDRSKQYLHFLQRIDYSSNSIYI